MEDYSNDPMNWAKRTWFNSLLAHLSSLGMDKSQIAAELNISSQRLTNVINGSDAVSDKIINKLIETYDLGPVVLSTKDFSTIGTADDCKERRIDRFDRYLMIMGYTEGQATANSKLGGDELKEARGDGNDLTDKQVRKLLKAFPDINENWLKNGDGDMRNHNAIPVSNSKEPMARILDLLNEEDVTLEEFAKAANSYTSLFNNALKYPFDSRNLFVGNDKQIRGWVDAFCDLFPKYSKFWILTGKTSKYNYPAIFAHESESMNDQN